VLIKRRNAQSAAARLLPCMQDQSDADLDRRKFLRRPVSSREVLRPSARCRSPACARRSGSPPANRRAGEQPQKHLHHCSVGCSVIGEVRERVWIGQEPVYDSPINRGSHCCKGAAFATTS